MITKFIKKILLLSILIILLYNGKLMIVEAETSKNNAILKNGTIIYFNPETNSRCTTLDYYNNTKNSDAEKNTGCMKWYVFLDDIKSSTLNLLLDHNSSNGSYWSSTKNLSGPNEALINLKRDTLSWTTKISSKNNVTNYTYSDATYTINYDDYHARFITAEEIAKIVGKNWNQKNAFIDSKFYFDTLSNIQPTEYKFGWLYDRINTHCTNTGCLNNGSKSISGYWTSSAVSGTNSKAWYIVYTGKLDNGNVDNRYIAGIRPVIEVEKDSLKQTINVISNHGTVNVISKQYAGSTVNFDIFPNEHYKLKDVKVIDSNNNEILIQNRNFIMPEDDVTLIVCFNESFSTSITGLIPAI